MTALFRGEYDPIEKFGVAMKQAEVNAVLAERGFDKLTGAQLRNAEQTVRYELLIERAADAIGVFAAQSGSLFTEQKKLGATFENMQAQLGTALLPAIVGVNEELRKMLVEATPGLIEIFNGLAEGLETLVDIFRDAMDPTTDLGESFAALSIQFNSLYKTIFGEDFSISQIFEAGAVGLGIFIDLLHDLMRFIEIVVIHLQVAGQAINDFFTDPVKFNNTNYVAMREELIAISSGAKDIRMNGATASDAIKAMRESVETADKAKLANLKQQIRGIGVSANYSANEIRRMRDMAGLPALASVIDTGGTGAGGSGGGGSGGSTPAAVASGMEQLNQLQTLSRKQAERQATLLGMGVNQGVVSQILSLAKPVKAANDVINNLTRKDGDVKKKAVNKLNKEFAAGIGEQNRIRDEQAAAVAQANQAAASAAAAAAEEARRQAEELRRAEEARIEGLNQLYADFIDTIKGTFAGIRNAIQGAFDITGLGGSTNAIIRNMNKLLAKMKSFSANVKSLATMGLDPALLQQIIQSGPVAGSRIAAALVSGGAGALATINAGFGQVGSLASEIAETGVRSLFDTQAQQNQYNITVTGGVGSGATIGKAIVEAIKDYERTSGAVWQGA
jgi:hypothetical protein